MGAQLRIRDQHVNARIVQYVIDLVGLEEVVDRHHNRAGMQDAEKRRDEFRAVLEPQANPVTGFDAKGLLEPLRDERGLAPQVGIRILAISPEQGDLLRSLLNGLRKGASQVHLTGFWPVLRRWR